MALLVIYTTDIRYEGTASGRAINVWDIAPCVLFDPFLPSWVLLLAFVLLTGDDLTAGRATGRGQPTTVSLGLGWYGIGF